MRIIHIVAPALAVLVGTGLAFAQGEAEIRRMRIFEEPVVPIGGEPSPAENVALAAALRAYS